MPLDAVTSAAGRRPEDNTAERFVSVRDAFSQSIVGQGKMFWASLRVVIDFSFYRHQPNMEPDICYDGPLFPSQNKKKLCGTTRY